MADDAEFASLMTKLWSSIGEAVSGASGSATNVDVDSPDSIPQRVGRYRVRSLLGKGGFGAVFLAHDEVLARDVAVKVPHSRLLSTPEQLERQLQEARNVASLQHPNIVEIFDVGSAPDFPLFIVSKFIPGCDLATCLSSRRFSVSESVAISAAVARALHYAHQRGLVHRDIKPANILLTSHGQPFIVDFGLALQERQLGFGPRWAGTPAYMSPEQARGEGHRVDGRSDIFSLGIVLYQLLSGRLPFLGESSEAMLEQIRTCEARPLRQIEHGLPKELERICMRALAKRLSDRYTTAIDFAEDLEAFLKSLVPNVQPAANKQEQPIAPESEGPAPVVVPKGLRSFDQYDADFFLELLPGPRDRHGLPESIRFWKSRLEQSQLEQVYGVSVLYGPSGCGKSSLVKAGILPRLASHVMPVYIEAEPGVTERRLLNALRRVLTPISPGTIDYQTSQLSAGDSLVELLADYRRDSENFPHKLVLVIDQFEQWLAHWDLDPSCELITALRHCDGKSLQCLILVRDDFWVATSRFMRALEIPLVENQNSGLVDLFDATHATNVLAAFGRAFGKLPNSERDYTPDQKQFLSQAVASIAEDGKVICVRLTMLAEMMKSKVWSPKTLREVGGVEGLGVAFLEDNLGSRHAPREHRYHQDAARRLLRELLPESVGEIKGSMRSHDELQRACGYVDRPQEFDRLLAILDSDLRLITPVDVANDRPDQAPERTSLAVSDAAAEPSQRTLHVAYQLTHDFLVPAVRKWSEVKQRESFRGRAELKLVERTRIWSATGENRQLPNLLEWCHIFLFSDRGRWKRQQTDMMRQATRHHVLRTGLAFACMACIAVLIVNWDRALRRDRATGIVNAILTGPSAQLPTKINEAHQQSVTAFPLLKEQFQNALDDEPRKLRAALALLRQDSAYLDFVVQRLPLTDAEFLPVLLKELNPYREELGPRLHRELAEGNSNVGGLHQLAALSYFDPSHPAWKVEYPEKILPLLQENAVTIDLWLQLFDNHAEEILEPIRREIDLIADAPALNKDNTGPDRATALLKTSILCRYARNDVSLLSRGLLQSDVEYLAPLAKILATQADRLLPEFTQLLNRRIPNVVHDYQVAVDPEEFRHELVQQKLRAALALMHWGHFDLIWEHVLEPSDPRLYSEVVSNLHLSGLSPNLLLNELQRQANPAAQQLIIMGLGKFKDSSIPQSEQKLSIDKLLAMYANTDDAGVRSALSWTLDRWNATERRREVDRTQSNHQALSELPANRNWYISASGIPMAILRGPMADVVGVQYGEWNVVTRDSLWQHRVHINHEFAIATCEVTLGQFQQCAQKYAQYLREDLRLRPDWATRTLDAPATSISYTDAALFCRWLGEQEGIAEHEQCYPKAGEIGLNMVLPKDFLSRQGYRLPTRAEWEIACRSGSLAPMHFGSRLSPMNDYAWSAYNSGQRNHAVGQLMPNRLGLFDMHGNAFEWCAGVYLPPPPIKNVDTHVDNIGPLEFTPELNGVLKGGDFPITADKLTAAYQEAQRLSFSWPASGLRVVRTLKSYPVACTLDRHDGNQVTYKITKDADVQIQDVAGPVQIEQQELSDQQSKGLRVVPRFEPSESVPCKYSFTVLADGRQPAVPVSGELMKFSTRMRLFRWSHSLHSPDDRWPKDWKAIVEQPPVSDERVEWPEIAANIAQRAANFGGPIAALIESELTVVGGRYEFWLASDDAARLWIDGQLLLDTWPTSMLRNNLERIALSAGVHQLRVEYYDSSPPTELQLSVHPLSR